MRKALKIGTRGSKLALIQTQLVADALRQVQPGLEIETVIIKTQGDQNMSPIPLDTVGKAWFTAEIDHCLRQKTIDLAVHSLKDLPLELEPGLAMTVVLPRADPRDVLVSRSGLLSEIPPNAIIGTDSARRRVQLLHKRPDLKVHSLRGNVQTRLRKLAEGEYYAVILAAAGLKRLDSDTEITEYLGTAEFVPAPGQGALAAETRADDLALQALLAQIQDQATVTATAAERGFSAAVGGNCQLPVGCYAQVESGNVQIQAVIADLEPGSMPCFDSTTCEAATAEEAAASLATQMLKKCQVKFPKAGSRAT
jgi:hydroxymethylbilane synthase